MVPSGARGAALTPLPEDCIATLWDVQTDHLTSALTTNLCTTSDVTQSPVFTVNFDADVSDWLKYYERLSAHSP